MIKLSPTLFKAYDVRGVYPKDFNEDISYAVAQCYTKIFHPKSVVIGRDVRLSGKALADATIKGFTDLGVDVVDISIVSTDAFYFAVGELPVDGGITLSASHNPKEWNGMNMCKKGAEPISSQSGLMEIKEMIETSYNPEVSDKKGTLTQQDVTEDFLKRVVSFIDPKNIKPCKVVANGNFGVDVVLLQKAVEMFSLPITIVPLNAEPNGEFPKGPPNPLLPENRHEFLDLIKQEHADLGVAWDADGDRCFFADELGNFIEGYFTTAILAKELLQKYPGSKIIIDPRLVWATQEEITRSGGIPIISKAGMTIIAETMKREGALFGGEMSSHFYFRDNYNRDNGLIPFFLIIEMMSLYNTPLSELAKPYTSKYFITGEMNFETEKKDEIIELAKEKYKDAQLAFIDGLSVEYDTWRFNLRKSNTEPLLRLNLEARSNAVMEEKRDELVTLITSNS